MKLRHNDYVMMGVACVFLGIAIVSQAYAGKKTSTLTQPENNEIIALEVAKLTKTTASLRQEVLDLTHDLNYYRNTTDSQKSAFEKYQNDSKRLEVINGSVPAIGQGILITIEGDLSTPQVVDLVNALKNIGTEVITVNGKRVTLWTGLDQFAGQKRYEIKVLGNAKLLKSALNRKGGIVDQIASKDIKIKISEHGSLSVESGDVRAFDYAHVVAD